MIENITKRVKPEDRAAMIAVARERESEQREMRLRLEALQDGSLLPECEHCGSEFTGRSDARFCSTQCRVAAHRARVKAEGQMTEAEKQAKVDEEHQADLLNFLEEYRENTKTVALAAQMGKTGPKLNKKILMWLRYAIEDIEGVE